MILLGAVLSSALSELATQLNPFNSTTGGDVPPQNQPAPAALADIPADYLGLYTAAAKTCPGLGWSVLAAVGKVESNHGRSRLPGVQSGSNSAGAQGPMQFLPTTFAAVVARHPIPPGGSTPPSPYTPHDAIYAAAALLCDNGARNGRNLSGAIWSYNHSQAYVARVLAQARAYAAANGAANTQASPPAAPAAPASSAAAAAIAFARSQLGRPYVWGGNGEVGFDCSGLTKAAYAAAGLSLPRTADTQFRAGPRLPAGQSLQPGDLVFYGTQTRITHVALYIGNNQVIHAPQQGHPVQIAALPRTGYAGATRPAGKPAPTPRGPISPAARVGGALMLPRTGDI